MWQILREGERERNERERKSKKEIEKRRRKKKRAHMLFKRINRTKDSQTCVLTGAHQP